jgi:protein-disulfide isomerase
VVLFAASLFAVAPAALAQSVDETAALKAEIEALKAGQQVIQKELRDIKRLLHNQQPRTVRRADPPFEPTTIAVDSAPTLGETSAPVTLIEFTDYQCPYCRRHSLQTKPRIVKDYVETGKLRYVLREFPIVSIHPQAPKAAQAALCAGDQDKYWEMNELFFANQKRLQPDHLLAHAEELGIDMARFRECFENEIYAERVRSDFEAGAAAGVKGTPSFLLGLTNPNDPTKITAIKILRGAQPYGAFQQAINELIRQSAEGS